MKQWTERLGKQLLFWDGGFGTELQSRGLRPGEEPISWNLTHPDAVKEVHQAYLDAGASLLTANTFGANRLKLGKDPTAWIQAGLRLARQAVNESGKDALVALDIAPCGKLLQPYGTLSFADAYEAFAEQVRVAVSEKADLIMIETMTDLYEAKAAILAAKEQSDLPFIVSFTFDENGKLLTGADIRTAFLTARSLGAAAVGTNCGLGPEQLRSLLPELYASAGLPLSVCPNAGLPELENGKTVYRVSPLEFAEYAEAFARGGASLLGGCCGTTPAHIATLVERCRGLTPLPVQTPCRTEVSSYTHTVTFGERPLIIGERLNPTGKPRLKQALRERNMELLLSEALAQADANADLLDLNVGLPDIDETALMEQAVLAVQSVTDLPLQLDSASPEALERGLRLYNGRPLVNSVNGSEQSMNAVLPLVKRYGACVVALTLDEKGIPATADERIAIAKRICERASRLGIPKQDLLIDALTMTVGTDQNAANVTLETVERVHRELGLCTVLGVSNCSFGLPERETLTGTFLSLAIQRGLSGAIMNPLSASVRNAFYASLALCGWDTGCLRYIQNVTPVGAVQTEGTDARAAKQEDTLFSAVERGLLTRARELAKQEIQSREPLAVVREELIPALDRVGKAFEQKKMFLPQLLMSADAAKEAFAVIQEALRKDGSAGESKGTVLLATVKDDVHDIGKNIVKVLLESYGFTVVDLGKNVPPETIVREARERDIRLVGLSALMTTTVCHMAETVRLLRAEWPQCRVVVGGAVLTQAYADQIGADCYAPDAMATVRYAERVLGKDT